MTIRDHTEIDGVASSAVTTPQPPAPRPSFLSPSISRPVISQLTSHSLLSFVTILKMVCPINPSLIVTRQSQQLSTTSSYAYTPFNLPNLLTRSQKTGLLPSRLPNDIWRRIRSRRQNPQRLRRRLGCVCEQTFLTEPPRRTSRCAAPPCCCRPQGVAAECATQFDAVCWRGRVVRDDAQALYGRKPGAQG